MKSSLSMELFACDDFFSWNFSTHISYQNMESWCGMPCILLEIQWQILVYSYIGTVATWNQRAAVRSLSPPHWCQVRFIASCLGGGGGVVYSPLGGGLCLPCLAVVFDSIITPYHQLWNQVFPFILESRYFRFLPYRQICQHRLEEASLSIK